jgi:pimeloyl-ACP methyl ester carboxylesterase
MKGSSVPIAAVNGIRLSYQEYGRGEPVLLIAGSGARGRTWTPHQVPALTAAGYRVITVDNRGVPPSDTGLAGFGIDDMVADTAGLIGYLGIGPCRIVGHSMGGMIVLELLLKHPGLVKQAVLMGTRGRTDAMRTEFARAGAVLEDSGITLPPRYAAVIQAMQYLSPQTLNDEQRIRDWLDVFEMTSQDPSVSRAQRHLDLIRNRLTEYGKIRSQCLVIGFQDDLVAPSFFCQEIAAHIPGCSYREISGCGHYGYLERPEAVNSVFLDFFRQAVKPGVLSASATTAGRPSADRIHNPGSR